MLRAGQDRQVNCSCATDEVYHRKDLYVDSFTPTLTISIVPKGSIQEVYKSMEELPQTS